ncbi:hypothetical protein QVD17_09869 [Tagetes erecta]|uniref:MADS-box domain-containing protein n=1 Tax=Tagetes erecta TaxID=13708 RepID=A0AAD8L5F9_TARER|nr:hypothetical protein QVD17_09869 [Tagetes erecta]
MKVSFPRPDLQPRHPYLQQGHRDPPAGVSKTVLHTSQLSIRRMGWRKLKMKRIEDKNSRLVTFSKRRSGLVKKARHLSVLCDVDVAVIVFSARGKLYESCSGTTNRYWLVYAVFAI